MILHVSPPSSHPTVVCFFPVGLSLLIQHFQQVLRVLKFLKNNHFSIFQKYTFHFFFYTLKQFKMLLQIRKSLKFLHQNFFYKTINRSSLVKALFFEFFLKMFRTLTWTSFEETSTPTRPVENVVIATKGRQEWNTQLLDGTTVEK